MDKDVKLLLDWLYLHRKEWLSAFQIMEGTQMSLDPFMIEWLVKNDLLTEVSVDSSSVYRISLGGIIKRAESKRSNFIEYSSLILSLAAVAVSLAAFFRP